MLWWIEKVLSLWNFGAKERLWRPTPLMRALLSRGVWPPRNSRNLMGASLSSCILAATCVTVISGCSRGSHMWILVAGETEGGTKFVLRRYQEGLRLVPYAAPHDRVELCYRLVERTTCSELARDRIYVDCSEISVRTSQNRVWVTDVNEGEVIASADLETGTIYDDNAIQPGWAVQAGGTEVKDVQKEIAADEIEKWWRS